MVMRQEDFDWFVENNVKLYKKYGDKVLAIRNKKVIGVYDDYAEGVEKTTETEKLGTFILQRCGKDESVYTISVASAL